jgi:hypothetical protein
MVKAADALWDACGSHNPTVAAAMTNCSRSPDPVVGKTGDKRAAVPVQKIDPLSTKIYSVFKPWQ